MTHKDFNWLRVGDKIVTPRGTWEVTEVNVEENTHLMRNPFGSVQKVIYCEEAGGFVNELASPIPSFRDPRTHVLDEM